MTKTNFRYDVITGAEILLTDKKVFKDDEEHPYVFVCYDGFAQGKHDTDKDPNPNCPDTILMSYPHYRELTPKKIEQIREYRGLDENVPLNYEDVAMKFGKIGKYGLTVRELEVIEHLAKISRMDCWLGITIEGNFYDRENNNKPISGKKAMCDFIEGLVYDDLANLDNTDKLTFVKALGKLLK